MSRLRKAFIVWDVQNVYVEVLTNYQYSLDLISSSSACNETPHKFCGELSLETWTLANDHFVVILFSLQHQEWKEWRREETCSQFDGIVVEKMEKMLKLAKLIYWTG
jgi:hypothetical protein